MTSTNGRPLNQPYSYRRLDKTVAENALKLASTGAMNDDIAAAIGVHRGTFYRWMADGRRESDRRVEGLDPDPRLDIVCDLYDGIRAKQGTLVAVAMTAWVGAIANGDWRAAEALLKTRFAHWRPSAIDPNGPAEGAGTVDDVADLAEFELTDQQARAIAGAMRRFGDALLNKVRADGIEAARGSMGVLARGALMEGE